MNVEELEDNEFKDIIGSEVLFTVNGKVILKAKITGWGFVYDKKGRHLSLRFDKKKMKKLQKLFDKYPDITWRVESPPKEEYLNNIMDIGG